MPELLSQATTDRAAIAVGQALSAELRKGSRPCLDSEEMSRLLEAVYAGADTSPPWQQALSMLRESFEAAQVTLILRPPSPGMSGVVLDSEAADPGATDIYQRHYFAFDPFVDLPADSVVTPQELLGSQWQNSAMLRDFLLPLDIEHLVGADITTREGISCRFRVARARGMRPFDARDKAFCGFLLPHLRRAIQLHARLDRLECERQLYAGTVSRMLVGVLSLDEDGCIVDSNNEARRILDERDGLWRQGDRLGVRQHAEAQELRALIARAAATDAPPGPLGVMAISRPSGRRPLNLVLRSTPCPWVMRGHRRPRLALFLRDPESGVAHSATEIVQRLFGFNRTEAVIALALADGLTLDEGAERAGITRNTARTYLRMMFCKAGVTRQTMLVRKLLNSVALL